jgi:hypothetical protein
MTLGDELRTEDALTRQSATAISKIDTRAARPKRRFDQRLVQRSVCDNDPRHNLTDRGIASSIGDRESASIPVRESTHELNQDLGVRPALRRRHTSRETCEPDQNAEGVWNG